MINYKIDEKKLESVIGSTFLQFFTKGGSFQLGDFPQIDSTDELILVFQKKTDVFVEVFLKFNGPLFSIKKDTLVDLKTSIGPYPIIDFNVFNSSINNPLDGLVSNIEIFYNTMENVDNIVLNYFKGIVINFASQGKVIIQSSDYPKSFSIFFDENKYQTLIENCKNRISLATE